MAEAQGRAGGSFFDRFKSGLNFSFKRGGSCVGLSIGASSVKVVQLKQTGKKSKNSPPQWILDKYAAVQLPELSTEHREIVNSVGVVQAIQSVLDHAQIKSKEVCSALAGSGLIIKNLTIVVTDMKELQDQVFWEAEQYIPFDISEVVIDFQVVSKGKENQVEVILVAVKKDYLEQYMSVIEEADLVPKIMDAEVFALQNAYESNYESNTTEAMLLADIGAVSTKIVICAGGIPYLTKDASFGGSMITQEIQRELNLPSAIDAETLKVSGNLPHEVSEIVARMCHVLGTELKKSIDFYTASSLGPPIIGVLISGGGSRAVHLAKIIEDYTGLPTQMLNPFQRIQGDSKKFTQEQLMDFAPEAVIPVGLAIRAGDKA
jgi:type IV pilus assembly protein PilM